MPLIGDAKTSLKKLLYRLVMGVRAAVLDRPRLRAALRMLGAPLIWLMLRLHRAPAPTVPDPVLRLPLDYAPAAPPLRTAILLHAADLDGVSDIASVLAALPFPADLVVTTTSEAGREPLEQAFAGWRAGAFEVRITPDRGRNVAAQLVGCRDVFDRCELVLVLQTAPSHGVGPSADWRNFLLRDLVGSPETARSAMELFARLPKLGVLAPRIFPPVRPAMSWGENYKVCRGLGERLGFALFPDSPFDFPAGFSFWARSTALRPLLDLQLDWSDFEPGAGQKAGDRASGLERLLFHACELSGHRWSRAGVEDALHPAGAYYAAAEPRLLARAVTQFGRTVLVPGRRPQAIAGVSEASLDPGGSKAAFRAACAAELEEFLQSGARLTLPTSEAPDVSILIVLYNQAELTFECLRSLRRALDVPCEVILVDNASSDRTADLLARIDGAKVLRNAENLHFLRGVNRGADLAVGRHLLLLNNDVRLAAGSIAAAVERLDSEPDLGAVGGRITLLDGTLQEAGSIIWSDGSCLGYGRGADPWAPEFQFRRDVDYCSGAFLMVPRELFERLGRFDMAFAPAYYEETDFCMRVRQAGLRISYEPRVQLSHFEFASSSSSAAALKLQADHQKVFVQRHAETLASGHLPLGATPLRARMRGAYQGKVLIVDDQVPYRELGSGYPRALDIVHDASALGWFVTLYPASFPDVDYGDAYRVLPPDVEIAAERGAVGLVDFMRERPGYYDAVIVSRPHNMEVFRRVLAEAPDFIDLSRVVYDAEAIFALRDAAKAQLTGQAAAASPKAVAGEVALSAGAGVVLAVNALEAATFRESGVAEVRVLGHALKAQPAATAFEDRRDLLFVGALDEDDSPNADSLDFFVRKVMPRLDELIGEDWILRVVGRNGARRVQALAGPRVQLLGRVEDVTPLYAQSRVFVAPTRYAAGIPMKVQEAAARGLPCAVTPLLAGQLGWADGEAVTVGDTADEFARACQRLYRDKALWEAVRVGALARIDADCSPAAFKATLAEALEIAAGRQAASSSSSLRMSVTGEATPPSSRMTLLQ